MILTKFLAIIFLLSITSGIVVGEDSLPEKTFDSLTSLTVEKIMRDRSWIGNSPSQPFWSEDGRHLYFNWNPENKENSHYYTVDRLGKKNPQPVELKRFENLPARRGDYDRVYNRKLYSKNGDLFLYDIQKKRTVQITNTLARQTRPRFSYDEKLVTYLEGDNLYGWNIETGTTTQLTDFRSGTDPRPGEKPESNQKSGSAHKKWLHRQQTELFETIREEQEKKEKKKNRKKEEKKNRRDHMKQAGHPTHPLEIYIGNHEVSKPALSPDHKYITFQLEKYPGDPPRTIVPDYFTESGFTEDLNARAKVGRPGSTYKLGIYDIANDTVYYVATEQIPGITDQPEYLSEYLSEQDSSTEAKNRPVYFWQPIFSNNGLQAVLETVSLDHKDRWIMLLNLSDGSLELLDRQHDEAWISGPGIRSWGRNIGWMPDNKRVWYQSEVTGYSHLWTVDASTGEKNQLTSGQFEIRSLKMSRDKNYWYFISNEIHPGEQQFYRMDINGGRRVRITTQSGGNSVYMSPDEKRLAVLHSTSAMPPELYLMDNRPGAPAQQITFSVSDEYLSYQWREPEIFTFTARDSIDIYSRIYKPSDLEPGAPVVMFVHGAGYTQNVHHRWGYYYREQMFHNLLADNGYLVMDIDFRGSAGYGRNFRTGIYRHMGGKDLDDYVDAVRYLIDNYQIDSSKVGIYGGSYGGFMALMALFTQPDIFAAGAALRPVTDWAHYNHEYTSNILNVPHLDSIAYARSSPINFAQGLEGSLLICHGMVDRNVHYQGVVRLGQRLIELGRENWEIASYPAEPHSFKTVSGWTDEYKRIFKLFEENLK